MVAGAGCTVEGRSNLVGGQASPDLRSRAAFGLVAVLGPIVGAVNAAGLPTLAGHPWPIGAVLFVALGMALAGIVTGVVAVIRRVERSMLVRDASVAGGRMFG